MLLLRLAAWMAFAPATLGLRAAAGSFWLGFRFDAREVGIVCLLILLLGSIPALHPFNSRAGTVLSLSLVFLFLLFMVLMYVFDFLHLRYL